MAGVITNKAQDVAAVLAKYVSSRGNQLYGFEAFAAMFGGAVDVPGGRTAQAILAKAGKDPRKGKNHWDVLMEWMSAHRNDVYEAVQNGLDAAHLEPYAPWRDARLHAFKKRYPTASPSVVDQSANAKLGDYLEVLENLVGEGVILPPKVLDDTLQRLHDTRGKDAALAWFMRLFRGHYERQMPKGYVVPWVRKAADARADEQRKSVILAADEMKFKLTPMRASLIEVDLFDRFGGGTGHEFLNDEEAQYIEALCNEMTAKWRHRESGTLVLGNASVVSHGLSLWLSYVCDVLEDEIKQYERKDKPAAEERRRQLKSASDWLGEVLVYQRAIAARKSAGLL